MNFNVTQIYGFCRLAAVIKINETLIKNLRLFGKLNLGRVYICGKEQKQIALVRIWKIQYDEDNINTIVTNSKKKNVIEFEWFFSLIYLSVVYISNWYVVKYNSLIYFVGITLT